VILYDVWRSGLWRAMDAEKLRFFLGRTPRGHLSHDRPLWRSVPWRKALFTASGSQAVLAWLRYRIELYDGLAG
jgi:hypothetical protein